MSYSEENSYEKILERALGNKALENMDKRVGSIIYDALAPVCMELAELYIKLDILEEQTYLMTSTGENLDKRVYDYGVSRIQATKAKRIASFRAIKYDKEGNPEKEDGGENKLVEIEVPIGTRFAVPADKLEITYRYIGVLDGNKILECEQLGTKGNTYQGTILPLDSVSGLVESSITGTYQPANDTETDEELRIRTKNNINRRAFGGNIPDYIERVKEISGVGNCKVFPAWQYNGSVLLSVVDSSYDPISDEFAKLIKKEIDPEESTGQGVGTAPIGHYVTVSYPVKKNVKVSLDIEVEAEIVIGTIQEKIEEKIEEYFLSVRKKFGQDSTLAIYRARIIEAVLKVPEVLNVSSVLLDDNDEDIIYNDEAKLKHQYLPYVQEVEVV